MAGIDFDPDKDIPDLRGKIILITGGTSGLGAESVIQLAKHRPAAIYFTGRNSEAAASILEQAKALAGNEVDVVFLQCDLTSLHSVSKATERFLASSDRLDVLMCNAGIMARPPALTQDGYEIQFGTNHIAHALLVKKLLPALLNRARTGGDARIVLLTSLGYINHPPGGIVFPSLKTVQDFGAMGSWTRYGQSKLANLLYARELARRYPEITTVAIHPGVVHTGLASSLSFAKRWLVYFYGVFGAGGYLSAAQGARNQLWGACGDRRRLTNGQMYEPVGLPSEQLNDIAKDDKLAEELWNWTEGELKDY